MDEAIQMKNEKLFTPSSGPVLKILPCRNGWGVALQHPYETDCSEDEVEYVFNSVAELAKAVANLVQFGTLERPEQATGAGLRPISEFSVPTREEFKSKDSSYWYAFSGSPSECQYQRFVTPDGISSELSDASHSLGGVNIFQWISTVGITHFRPLGEGELDFLK